MVSEDTRIANVGVTDQLRWRKKDKMKDLINKAVETGLSFRKMVDLLSEGNFKEDEDPIIGYLQMPNAYCVQHKPAGAVPLYRSNVYPYNQTCATCGAVLCQGQTPAWPNLFNK